jgi:hypothetical protein
MRRGSGGIFATFFRAGPRSPSIREVQRYDQSCRDMKDRIDEILGSIVLSV